ncbi:hypothetical protein NUSPORA_00182 [Nucleospora cyclopteri]
MKQENSEGRKDGIISCNSCGKLCFNSCPNCNNGMFKMDLIEQNRQNYGGKNFVSPNGNQLYNSEIGINNSTFSNHVYSPSSKQFIENNDFILGGKKDMTSLDLLINCDSKMPTPKRKEPQSIQKSNLMSLHPLSPDGLFGKDHNSVHGKSSGFKNQLKSPDFVFSNTFNRKNNIAQNSIKSPQSMPSQINPYNVPSSKSFSNFSNIMPSSPSLGLQPNKHHQFKQAGKTNVLSGYNKGVINRNQIPNIQHQNFNLSQSSSQHRMMQQFNKGTKNSNRPLMMNETQSMEAMKQKMPRSLPISAKSHPLNGKSNTLSVVVDMNLSTSPENLMNLLNIKPVDYSYSIDQEIVGMYMKKKNSNKHQNEYQ